MSPTRYECRRPADNVDKFWQYAITEEITGSYQLVIEWGRRGTVGQRQVRYFSTREAAGLFVSAKLSEKLAKGYLPCRKDSPSVSSFDSDPITARLKAAAESASRLARMVAAVSRPEPKESERRARTTAGPDKAKKGAPGAVAPLTGVRRIRLRD